MYKIKTRRYEVDLDDKQDVSDDLKSQVRSDIAEKQKVFYFCHPNDTKKYSERVSNNEETYFGLISKDILDIENCVIFYIDDADNPEYTAILESASMFVALVTGDFVYDETGRGSILNILKFAKEHNKPVLPIMVEPDLEERFNSDFGELQLLDRNSSDPTQISYKVKLENYLSSVIISDELANKVKNEFDSYIFLSYRKKDREHAQKLMRLIHSNKKYLDIAIWYDEFLIPGENFKTSIDAAMAKSNVFALAVTPNILEEYKKGKETVKNFVMGVEYPEAVKLQKRIFPVELVPTDKEQLKDKFTGIEDCVNADDEETFSASLASALDGVSNPENDTPEHNYLIGLAYLNGIDVEENGRYALNLILSSAVREYAPAMKQLADMYKIGIRTDIDPKESLHWQERYSKYLKNVYENSGSEEDGCAYAGYILEICGYCEVNYIKNVTQKYEEALRVCEELNGRFNSMKTRKLAARCCERLGLIYHSVENNYDKACEYIDKAFNGYENIMLETYQMSSGIDDPDGTLREFVKKPLYKEAFYNIILSDDKEYHIEFDCIKEELKDVLRTLTNMVKILINHRDSKSIENIALNAVNIAVAVYCKCGKKFEDKLALAECLLTLGDVVSYRLDMYTEAAGYYLKALETFSENISENKGIDAHIKLISVIFKTANAYRDMAYEEYRGSRYYDVAENYYMLAIEQAEVIVQAAITPKTYFILAQCYANVMNLYSKRIYDILEPTNHPAADRKTKMENLRRIDSLLINAFNYLGKYEEYAKKVVALEPKIQDTDDFFATMHQKAHLYLCAAQARHTIYDQDFYTDEVKGDELLAYAVNYYDEALRIFAKLYDCAPKYKGAIKYTLQCCHNLYALYHEMGITESVDAYLDLAVKLAEISENKRFIYNEYMAKGCFCFNHNRYSEAAEIYQKALEYVRFADYPEDAKKFLENRIKEAMIKSWLERFC